MVYIGKVAYNIGGSTIHSWLTILLKKSINDFKPLVDEKRDALMKQYTQLKLLVLDEISLIGSWMFSFIDKRLGIIKHNHNNFFGNLDVLIISDFHQVPPIRDSWVFHSINDGLNFINTELLARQNKMLWVVSCYTSTRWIIHWNT